ncbi:MAG: hypothetical protein R3C44_19610 [Chloroflexota bacterium]
MNTLRKPTIVRATAVLLLLVALIGVLALPAAMAQDVESGVPIGQEVKQLPVVTEPGESLAVQTSSTVKDRAERRIR